MQDYKKPPQLAVVVPCYNEEESLPQTIKLLWSIIESLSFEGVIANNSYLCFVDDGSSDATWMLIAAARDKNHCIGGVKLSKNFGHQSALLAGLISVKDKCDISISLDADLQQDPWMIRNFVEKHSAGAEIVLGVRNDRSTDTVFKKMSARGFYSLMRIFGVTIVPNHADYRLLSKRAMDWLSLHTEPNPFLRAICAQLGLRTEIVYFDVKERFAGSSKYSLVKMLRLALNGITSFSVVPLRLIAVLGLMVFALSACMGLYVLYRAIVVGAVVPGWASTTLPIYFLGGIQMLCLAIIGEYIAQVLVATKGRPRFLIEKELL
ncbi:glycosyltransferase family 2 protein [Curvibacter sp. CHRR-16]|uniref:glycosyltransferase family 2 protein n=1 Tax=Curvibacter sp. CHRR-16 TaxID=2835872 RepID=UPI001BD93677|nr:glycosyltransferase family 2 protein [Curvibacter sp. CHRR-16]MBT0571899.1 glycosyltransferase family 2 protein [Curvibacter sp. CHRR-16]